MKPFEPSTRALVRGAVAANTRVNEPQKPDFDSLRPEELATLPPGVDQEKTNALPDEWAAREKWNKIALKRGVGRVVASREAIEKRPMVETLSSRPDAVYTRMMTVDTNPVAIHQSMKGLQPLSEKAIAKRTESLPIDLPDRQAGLSADRQDQASPRQVARYEPPSGTVTRPDEFALARKVSSFLPGKTGSARFQPVESQSHKVTTPVETNGEARELGQTINHRDQFSRAEDIILAAIRSKADIDGKNAKVAYDVLAAMTGFSRRHVIRAVKSLIFERGRLRVDKRVLKPGHNAINVYQVVSRDATAAEKGMSIQTGKPGQTETTRVTEHVTQIAEPRTIPPLRHAPLSSAFVTPDSTYLTAGRKPRYLTQELPPPEKVAA